MYYLFGGEHYYPGGGMRDYAAAYTSIDAAMEAALDPGWDWAQIAFLTPSTRELVEVARWEAGGGWVIKSNS